MEYRICAFQALVGLTLLRQSACPGTCSLNLDLRGIGLGVAMAWLVIAKRMIAFHGSDPILAAGGGEWLPLRDGQLSGVVSLDVIEHVRDPDRYLCEIDRVVGVGGSVALSTPNRFSLTSEPHVFVWGVGWLPKSLQAPFVRWRSGKDYDDTVLMSSFELSRRIRRNTYFQVVRDLPLVPQIEIDRFPKAKAQLARVYNQIRHWRVLRIASMTSCLGAVSGSVWLQKMMIDRITVGSAPDIY